MQLKRSVETLMQKQNLDKAIFPQLLEEMLDEQCNDLQAAALIVLLRSKPETADEMAGLLFALREKMKTVKTEHRVLDIVGTGGDGAGTVNISTGSAILAASCGVKVAKHGNRAVSSQAGSADVLEALGINIHLSPEGVSACIDQLGIGFCFAPNFHPAMARLRTLRQKLNIPSTFNLMGPLLNPARASHFLLGVSSEHLLPLMADLLVQLGVEKSMVVHGNGLDEISSAGKANIIEVSLEGIKPLVIDPEKWGFSRCDISDLKGGDAFRNASLLEFVLAGNRGPIADTLIINVASALYLYGGYSSIEEALPVVRERLYSGAALKLLNRWKELSNELS